MKKRNTTLILSLVATLAFSQNDNLYTVKNSYPEVYRSIESSADNQWDFNPKAKAEVIQGQINAFLHIVELNNLSDKDLVDAIIKNSLPDTKEHNIRTLSNSNTIKPLSQLKCDWYKVESDYRKKKTNNNSIIDNSTDSATTEVIIIEDSYNNNMEPKENLNR